MPKIQTTKVYYELDNAIKSGYKTVSEQGSARSGKTRNTVIWLCAFLMRHPGLRLSVVRKTLTALRGSVLIDFKEVLVKMGLWEWSKRAFNRSEFIFTFPNGSWIEFFSTDDEQKLRGRTRDICYVNEANELSELEWQQLKMRTKMFTIADYNPSFSDEHWLCQVNLDPRTYHFITTYKDNPFLEQTIVDEIESLQYKNKTLWQVYGLGIQAVIEGLIFTNVEIIDEIPDYAKRHHWRGMDFGFSQDPTAIEDVYYYNNTLYIDEICYNTAMLTTDIIKVLKDHDGAVETISESADPRLIQEIYRGGCNVKPVVKYPGSIMAGITKMLEYKICITKRSPNVIKEFKNYTWAQDKEGKWLNQPIDAFNHCFVGSTLITTAKGLKRIDEVTPGEYVLTSGGYRQVLDNHYNGVKKVFSYSLLFNNFTIELICTPEHKIKTTKGWTEIQNLTPGDKLYLNLESIEAISVSSLTEKSIPSIKGNGIIQEGVNGSISQYGNIITGQFHKGMKFTTKISIALTTIYQTLSALLLKNTGEGITKKYRQGQAPLNSSPILIESEQKRVNGTEVKKVENGIANMGKESPCLSSRNHLSANAAGKSFGLRNQTQSIVPTIANQKRGDCLGLTMKQGYVNGAEKNLSPINTLLQGIVQEVVLSDIRINSRKTSERVYDLTVEDIHEYIANGVVVHNCIDGIRYCVIMKILGGRPKPVNMTRLENIAY